MNFSFAIPVVQITCLCCYWLSAQFLLLFLLENHSHMSVSVVLMSKHIFFVSLSASMHVYASAYVIQCLGLDAYGCNNYVFFCQKFMFTCLSFARGDLWLQILTCQRSNRLCALCLCPCPCCQVVNIGLDVDASWSFFRLNFLPLELLFLSVSSNFLWSPLNSLLPW